MKSHVYEFNRRQLLEVFGFPLVPLAAFCVFIHAGVWLEFLPPPLPILDADRTIIVHQASASRARQQSDIVLIGDSSCLMNVSARHLNEIFLGRRRAINLGTLSFLDLPAFASLVRSYVSANPGQLRALVLLMHPEALRRPAPSEYHVEVLNRYYEGADFCNPLSSRWICSLGAEIAKGRLWSRVIPNPLTNAFSGKYGFTSDLWAYLSSENGSAIDPRTYDPATARGNAEYRLAARVEDGSRIFRSAVPPGAQLFVGITPLPEGFAAPNYRATHAEMLRQWAEWLNADSTLVELPAMLPDSAFAGVTHLNEQNRLPYTELLAQLLSARTAED